MMLKTCPIVSQIFITPCISNSSCDHVMIFTHTRDTYTYQMINKHFLHMYTVIIKYRFPSTLEEKCNEYLGLKI